MLLDDLKLHTKSEQGPLRALLIHIVRLFEMDFEIEKCAKFIWRRGKVTACMELNHQRDQDEGMSYKYIGIRRRVIFKEMKKIGRRLLQAFEETF